MVQLSISHVTACSLYRKKGISICKIHLCLLVKSNLPLQTIKGSTKRWADWSPDISMFRLDWVTKEGKNSLLVRNVILLEPTYCRAVGRAKAQIEAKKSQLKIGPGLPTLLELGYQVLHDLKTLTVQMDMTSRP